MSFMHCSASWKTKGWRGPTAGGKLQGSGASIDDVQAEMLIWGKQGILGKVLQLLKLFTVFEVLSQAGVGSHIVKCHVLHAKFLMAKVISV